jgi:hypothetical protein
LNAGAWLRRVRFVIISPVPRHHRRVQAEIPLIPVFEFGQPPLGMNPSDHPQPEFVNGGRLLTYGHDVATWADKVY